MHAGRTLTWKLPCSEAVANAGERLLAGQADPALRAKLTAALCALTAANGVTASADRANRRRFRANLGQFVADARSIVRTQ